jgi:predicted transposase/invertase (TIGR01784 family)
MGSGDQHDKIQKSVTIVITGENFIPDSDRYFHRFTFNDPDAGVEFTDLKEICTLELGKLPIETDGTARYDWAKFIAAETEEELDMIAQRNPQIKSADVKLRELSAAGRARDMFERREKSRRDEWAFACGAEQKAKDNIARNAIDMGMDTDTIIKLTGLTRAEVEGLRDAH